MLRIPRAVFFPSLLSLLGTVLFSPPVNAQALLPTATAIGVNVKAPPLGMTAAKGNGQADDTAALQAEIQYCQDHNVPLLLAPGVYKITSPLHISIPPDEQTAKYVPILSGIVIRGLTNGATQPIVSTGVTIQMAGQRQDALIEVDGGASYHMVISDLMLDGGPEKLHTKYAIHAGYTRWSALRMDNVLTEGVDTACAFTGTPHGQAPTGSNGEEFDCYSCHFNARHTAYLNSTDSGQAYLHHFFACSIWIKEPGGIAFEIGNGNLGCQCDFYGTSMTMTEGGPVPNVFFQDDGTTDPINWWGGRAEHVDTLIKWNGGSGNQSGHVNIQGMAFPTGQGRGPLFSGGGTNSNYWFTIRSCYFDNGGKPVPLGFTYGGGGFEHIKLDECDFMNWSDLTALVDSPHVFLSDCRYFKSDGIAHNLRRRQADPDGSVPVRKAPIRKVPIKTHHTKQSASRSTGSRSLGTRLGMASSCTYSFIVQSQQCDRIPSVFVRVYEKAEATY